MQSDFRAEFGRAYHGGHHVGGDSFVAIDGVMNAERRKAVMMHELVHGDLVDNSVFGHLQHLILSLTKMGTRAERAEARNLLDTTMAVSLITHEGLASYRELAYVSAHLGSAEAQSYVTGLPATYQQALNLARASFGDPITEIYCGYPPQIFHLAIVGLGLAALSGPVLAAYQRPDNLIDSELLPWIVENGPDHRFRYLCNNPDIRDALHVAARRLESQIERLKGTDAINQAYDLVQELVAEAAPTMPFTSRRVRRAQAERLRPPWNAYFEERNTDTVGAVLVPGSQDVTFDRALRMGHVWSKGGRTGLELAESASMGLEQFVRTHQREQIKGIRRLVILGAQRQPESSDAQMDAIAGSIPVWIPGPGKHSPVVRFQPNLSTVAPAVDFNAASGDLSDAGCIWYSHYTRIQLLRSLEPGLAGPAIEQYPTPIELLGALDSVKEDPVKATYEKYIFGDEEIFGISWDQTFRFTFVNALQNEALLDRLRHRVVLIRPEESFRVGEQTVSYKCLARLALLGFTGR
ncbi:hypothetical protein [Micromonospora zamorensis]|uniref:hypothetical protein n=1 Tax=Micromonospora zamorensis TaxID=709883 RepID=UPI0033D06D63